MCSRWVHTHTHTHTRVRSGNPGALLWALGLIVDEASLCVHTSTAGWILLAQAARANNRLTHSHCCCGVCVCVCVCASATSQCDQTIVSFYILRGCVDVKRPFASCHAASRLTRSLYNDPRRSRPACPPSPTTLCLFRVGGWFDWVFLAMLNACSSASPLNVTAERSVTAHSLLIQRLSHSAERDLTLWHTWLALAGWHFWGQRAARRVREVGGGEAQRKETGKEKKCQAAGWGGGEMSWGIHRNVLAENAGKFPLSDIWRLFLSIPFFPC